MHETVPAESHVRHFLRASLGDSSLYRDATAHSGGTLCQCHSDRRGADTFKARRGGGTTTLWHRGTIQSINVTMLMLPRPLIAIHFPEFVNLHDSGGDSANCAARKLRLYQGPGPYEGFARCEPARWFTMDVDDTYLNVSGTGRYFSVEDMHRLLKKDDA